MRRAENNELLLLSIYPLSQAYLNSLKDTLKQDFKQVLVAELRQKNVYNLFLSLRSMKPKMLILPFEDENSFALLPVLKLLSGFTKSKEIKMVTPSLDIQPISRMDVAVDFLRFSLSCLECLCSAFLSGFELKRLLKKKRCEYHVGETKGKVIYLKTNLWFGIKAGGSVGHIAGVVNALQGDGYSVTFASAEEPAMVDRKVKIHKVDSLQTFGIPYELNNYRFQRKFARDIESELKGSEVFFIYQRLSAANYLGVPLSRAYKVPLIVEYNGSEVWIAKHWGKPMRFHKLAAMAEEAMLKHAQLVVTVSDVLKDELIDKGVEPERIVCYPNCIDPKIFSPERFSKEDIQGLRARYDIPVDAIVISFIGTFGQWHGADVLAKAIAYLWTDCREWLKNYKVHFLLVGDGLKMPKVKECLEKVGAYECCTLTGLIPQVQAPLHLAAADILASPHVANKDGTQFFGSPTKLFEYMAMGKGIVASRLNQIGEVLSPALDAASLPLGSSMCKGDELAVLSEPGNLKQLIEGIKFLVEHGNWRTKLGDQARKVALEKYTWQRHVDEILKTLK